MTRSTRHLLYRIALVFSLAVTLATILRAQAAPSASAAAWTVKMNGQISWQQVTPSGALLVSSDAALIGVDIERGQVAWQRPDLGGLAFDSVKPVESSLLMEAQRPGLMV